MSQVKYAILRVEKLKSISAIRSSVAHSWRLLDTPNADPSRSKLNRYSVSDSAEIYVKINDLLPKVRRRNAVLVLEYLVASSTNALDDQTNTAYFNQALQWLTKRHGAQTIAGWAVHMDETTPHLTVYVVPLDGRGALNASAFIDGRKSLSDMQTEFARDVAERYGLKRGIMGSSATHIEIRKLYAEIEQSLQSTYLSAEDLMALSTLENVHGFPRNDAALEVIDRLNNKIRLNVQALAARASLANFYEIRDQEQKVSLQRLQSELDEEKSRRLASDERARRVSSDVEAKMETGNPTQDSQHVERLKRIEACKRRVRELDLRNQNESTERYIRLANAVLIDNGGQWDSIDWLVVDRTFYETERRLTSDKYALLCLIASSPSFAALSASEKTQQYRHFEILFGEKPQCDLTSNSGQHIDNSYRTVTMKSSG